MIFRIKKRHVFNVNWLESYSSWREKISKGLFFFWQNTKMIDVLIARLEQTVYGNNNAFSCLQS